MHKRQITQSPSPCTRVKKQIDQGQILNAIIHIFIHIVHLSHPTSLSHSLSLPIFLPYPAWVERGVAFCGAVNVDGRQLRTDKPTHDHEC